MPIVLNYGVNQFLGFEVYGQLFGQETRTRFVYKCTEIVGTSTAEEAAENFVTDKMTPLLAILSNEFSVANIRVRKWSAAKVLEGWYDKTVNLGGGDVGESLPPSVAWVVKKFTGVPGRANRGRWYFPAVSQERHEDGVVAAEVREAMETAIAPLGTNLLDPESTAVLAPQLVSYFPSGNLNAAQTITAALPTWVFRSQRRREVGVGI